ncbi:hypothetical protein TSUD_155060 [Trifolium subterraneum]|uniref:OTU domain-containing protein n=1 Tax=Trifolium subterraneum TaxID=3900 RepID=A0A2Z6MI91_TRISU|nr:hypothetical protein TSUD_155060 [Trifolium subterraneum]
MDMEKENVEAPTDGVEPQNAGLVDSTIVFTTDKVFATCGDLLKWAKKAGKENGVAVVIYRSEKATAKPGTRTKLILACERSGKYRPWKNPKPVRGWTLQVEYGMHNHDLSNLLTGHSFLGRLSHDEKNLLGDMTKNMVKPRNILMTFRDHNEESLTTIKKIYNARQAYRSSIRGNRTKMQHLMSLMERDKYVYRYRKVNDSDELRDILWAHPDSIALVNKFHLVLIMDTTYKTCKYRLPLLEIVGATSTGMTFSIAFAYLQSECTDNFVWALQMLKELITCGAVGVIVTDRDLALMNAVQIVFPDAVNLLCLFHVCKNVRAKCKLTVSPKKKRQMVMEAWEGVVYCSDEVEYRQQLEVFKKVCNDFSNFHDYVHEQWLIPHKERFVEAWTNKVMHLGNTTTNRAESAHWSLKRILQDSMGDICSVWEAASSMITLQHNEIKASFERSIFKKEHRHNTRLYVHLRGHVSRHALSHIVDEFDRVKYVGIDKCSCRCIIRTTHGLPCACELAKYSMMPCAIPLDAIHIIWRKLNFFDDEFSKSSELSLKPEIDALIRRFDELDMSGKIALKSKVHEIAFPITTSMCPPPDKAKHKGAPKKVKRKVLKREKSTKRNPSWWEHVDATMESQSSVQKPTPRPSTQKLTPRPSVNKINKPRVLPFMNWIPKEVHHFIDDVLDVGPDGNCGYRAIGALLGRGEDSWPLIRQECFVELNEWKEEYARMFGGEDYVQSMMQSLYVDKYATRDKWMTLPAMGHVIASKYNIILVSLSVHMPMTFFPLRNTLSPSSNLIVITHVNYCHWVQPNSPIPPATNLWIKYCREEARSWEAA